jgi:hypothetical protein
VFIWSFAKTDILIKIYFFLYNIMGKTNRRSMRKGGGFWQTVGYPDNANSDTGTDTGTGISGTLANISGATVGAADAVVNTVATTSKKTTDYLGITSPDSQDVAPSGGRRRRRRRKSMSGGDFMPNSPLTGFSSNATEVHDIKMAQPQTLVGGRRRRKSSRRRGKSSRKSQRKSIKRSRSSRRN